MRIEKIPAHLLDPYSVVDRAELVRRVMTGDRRGGAGGSYALDTSPDSNPVTGLGRRALDASWIAQGVERAQRRDAARSEIAEVLAKARNTSPEIASATAEILAERKQREQAEAARIAEAGKPIEERKKTRPWSNQHAKRKAGPLTGMSKKERQRIYKLRQREKYKAAGLRADGKPWGTSKKSAP